MHFPLRIPIYTIFISFALLHYCLGQTNSVRFVKPVATGSGDGLSWENASGDLQAMMNSVQPTSGAVFVAIGLYRTTSSVGRGISFSIPVGIHVYGNCVGTETSPEQRTLTLPSSTTLSGEIGNPSSTTDNSYHVVVFKDATPQTQLDGFVITAGYSGEAGSTFPNYVGAGIYNYSTGLSSNPTIVNCQIMNNTAFQGGGLYNNGMNQKTANPTLINCLFSNNNASYSGAGIVNEAANSGHCNPVLVKCQFIANVCKQNGGAIENTGDFNGEVNPVFTNCIFINNQASSGGAVVNFIRQGCVCKPVFTNCLFSRNTATTAYGGAIFNFSANASCYPTLINCTVSKNIAVDYYQGTGGGMYTLGSGICQSTILNSIFWGNISSAFLSGRDNPSISGSGTTTLLSSDIEKLANVPYCVQCTGNIDVDPLFVAAPSDSLQLKSNSPVINKGSSSTLLAGVSDDLAGQPRISGCRIDIGAYEFQSSEGNGTFSIRNGRWNDSSIWSCGQVPTSANTVGIKHAITIPLGYQAYAKAINYDPGQRLFFEVNSQLILN